MPQKQYHVKLDDGREFNVTTDGEPPSEDDIFAYLDSQKTTAKPVTEPSKPTPVETPSITTPTSRPDTFLDEVKLAALRGPTSTAKLLADKAIRSYGLDKIIAQMSGKETGPFATNPEQNPLIGKSFLPETEADPGVMGAVKHAGYEFARGLASPQGIAGMLFDVAPESSTTATQLAKAGVRTGRLGEIAEAAAEKSPSKVVSDLQSKLDTATTKVEPKAEPQLPNIAKSAKMKLRQNTDGTYTNLDTGEILDKSLKPIDEWGNPVGTDYTQPPPTPEEIARDAERARLLKEQEPTEEDLLRRQLAIEVENTVRSHWPDVEEARKTAMELLDSFRADEAKPVGRGTTRDNIPKLTSGEEPELSAPTEAGIPQFNRKGKTGETGKPFDPSTLNLVRSGEKAETPKVEASTTKEPLKTLFKVDAESAPDISKDLASGNFRTRPVIPTEKMVGTKDVMSSNPADIPDKVLSTKIDRNSIINSAKKGESPNVPVVSFTPDGNVYIHEGHARFAKALETGQKVNSVIVDQRPGAKQINAFQNIANDKKLVGMARSKSPSEPPKVRLGADGSVTDSAGNVLTSIPEKPKAVDVRRNWTTEILNLPRAIQASYDISFPFRQGLALVHTKGWWTSWDDMLKSLGSENAFRATMDSILEKPNYRRPLMPDGSYGKSLAEKAGLDLTDLLSRREESMLSSIAEKIPGIRASNRAYTAFANKLRSDVFDSLIDQARKQGLNPDKNIVLAKQIASYVNNASGRGSLGALERNANTLAGLFFSPKMIASRLRMGNELLNPMTYRSASPLVKQQYWKSMFAMAGTWLTLASLAKLGGADVSLDPNSADFGKIKIGNTRLDPAGGFQQYIVLASRLMSGKYTSSATGKTTTFGSRYGARTRTDAITDFVQNKFAPVPSYLMQAGRASSSRPFDVTDKTVRLMTPMIAQDISELMQDDPTLLPTVGATAIGMGVQTYGERGESKRILPKSVLPEVKFKGGSLF